MNRPYLYNNITACLYTYGILTVWSVVDELSSTLRHE